MNKNNNKIKHELIARLGPHDMLGLHFSLLKHPNVSSQRYLAWVHVLLAAAVQTPACELTLYTYIHGFSSRQQKASEGSQDGIRQSD